MIFTQILSGGDRNFSYLIGCKKTGKAALVDPSPDPLLPHRQAGEMGLSVEIVFNTHSHPDHTGGNDFMRNEGRARIVSHTSAPSGDIRVEDGETIRVGTVECTVFHTPGHTEDSICILVGKQLVTGDTLFVGKVGGTAGKERASAEFNSLKRLLELDGTIRVWPGHNYGIRPSSTIAAEKTENPFCLRLNNFNDFFWLKENWADYKVKHGIQ